MATKNPLSYVNPDFDNIKQELTNRLSNTSWKDVYESGTGQMIIEHLALVTELLLYYLERRAEECYIATARNKSSLINLTRLIGYTPQRVISAIGTLQFSIAAVSTQRVFIPQYTECQTANGTKFVTIYEATIEPGALTTTMDALQGSLIELEYVSDGSLNKEINVNDVLIENDGHEQFAPFRSFRVLVDDSADILLPSSDGVAVSVSEWLKVSSFLASADNAKHYKLRYELDDTLTIIFGDNKNGEAPATNKNIYIKYVKSNGVDGNVYELSKVIVLNDSLTYEDGTAATVAVTNTTTMVGGDAAEDMEEIREEAPQVFATGDRAVTKLDFNSIILNYGSVQTVNVWGEKEEYVDLGLTAPASAMNVIYICLLLGNWQYPTSQFKTNLTNYIHDKDMLCVKYEFRTAEVLEVIALLNLYVVKGNSLAQTHIDAETVLENSFLLGSTSKLGVSKYRSNLMDDVDSLAPVSYHHLTLEVKKLLTTSGESGVDYGATMEGTPLLPGGVKVYALVDGVATYVGIDDENGAFTSIFSGYTIGGTVNYITGVVEVTYSGPTASSVYIRYQQNNNGDILLNNNQIAKLLSVEVPILQYIS